MQKVDERGKFFTERVSKQRVEVLIATVFGHVRGYVHVARGQRLKDMLNNSIEQFIAVTDATISARNGEEPEEVKLAVLNKQHLFSVIPVDESQLTPQDDEYSPY